MEWCENGVRHCVGGGPPGEPSFGQFDGNAFSLDRTCDLNQASQSE